MYCFELSTQKNMPTNRVCGTRIEGDGARDSLVITLGNRLMDSYYIALKGEYVHVAKV